LQYLSVIWRKTEPIEKVMDSTEEKNVYVKWVNHDMCNRNLQLKVGLNKDIIPFNAEGSCVAGGI